MHLNESQCAKNQYILHIIDASIRNDEFILTVDVLPFFRTKAEPPIYYSPARPLEDDSSTADERKQQVAFP